MSLSIYGGFLLLLLNCGGTQRRKTHEGKEKKRERERKRRHFGFPRFSIFAAAAAAQTQQEGGGGKITAGGGKGKCDFFFEPDISLARPTCFLHKRNALVCAKCSQNFFSLSNLFD